MDNSPHESPSTSKADRDAKALMRRELIQEEVRLRKSVSFNSLIEKLGVKEQSLYKDGQYFIARGIPITIRDKVFVPGPDRHTTIARRKTARTDEKEALADIAADVILTPEGLPLGPRDLDVGLISQMYLPGAHITEAFDAKLLSY